MAFFVDNLIIRKSILRIDVSCVIFLWNMQGNNKISLKNGIFWYNQRNNYKNQNYKKFKKWTICFQKCLFMIWAYQKRKYLCKSVEKNFVWKSKNWKLWKHIEKIEKIDIENWNYETQREKIAIMKFKYIRKRILTK